MTNGEPVRVRVAMKPISTVPRALRTVDVATGEPRRPSTSAPTCARCRRPGWWPRPWSRWCWPTRRWRSSAATRWPRPAATCAPTWKPPRTGSRSGRAPVRRSAALGRARRYRLDGRGGAVCRGGPDGTPRGTRGGTSRSAAGAGPGSVAAKAANGVPLRRRPGLRSCGSRWAWLPAAGERQLFAGRRRRVARADTQRVDGQLTVRLVAVGASSVRMLALGRCRSPRRLRPGAAPLPDLPSTSSSPTRSCRRCAAPAC